MGELHLAFSGHADLRKLCVIKTILGHLADDEFVNRFVDEAKVVVKLNHGNLVPIFEAGKAEGRFFLTMEYIDGKDLRDVWLRHAEEQRGFPLDVALFIVKEICRGLSYVHSYGDLHLVHRDVSPPNVLLSYTGEVRLTDFGVATSTIKLQKTAPGILMGKLSYMSPEQARNDPVDPRADLWSLGVILWELITGQRFLPPEGDQLERYQAAINPKVEPPSKYVPKIPPALDLVVMRALATDVEHRYPNAEEMRKDLTKLLAELAPAIDASAVQGLLRDLYGDEIEQEREKQRELMESMAPQVKQLVSESKTEAAAVAGPGDETLAIAKGRGARTSQQVRPIREEDLSSPYLASGSIQGDRYRIDDLIGEGGMGRVYLATHVEIDKQVAFKVLHPSYSRMPELVSRFRREAKAASKIGNPHIVEVYDSGTTEEGSIYFVMEYLTGIDLADELANEGRLSVQRTVKIGIQICEAVAAAHEAGIIHRDLKPENIFLTTREGTPDFVKVLDFGLAQSLGLEETRKERLTNPGMAMGTPEYMAPEQAAGKPTDSRSDVYSVGTLLYEMLVGTPPHMGDNILEVFNRKATQPIVPPVEQRSEITPELDRLVLWTLEYNADDRPQTMAQLAYELTKLASGRADAVASLLGIPASSRNTSGPAIALREPIVEDSPPQASYDVEQMYTAHVAPSKTEKTGGGRWWIVGVVALLFVGLAAGVWMIRRGSAPGIDKRAGGAPGRNGSPHQVPAGARGDGALAAAADASTADARRVARVKRRPRPPRTGESHVARGRRHLRAGRFDEARAAFKTALRRRRGRAAALLGLAEVEFQLGRYQAAKQYATLAVSARGGWRAKLVLANVHYKLRNYKTAVRLYEAVLAAKRNHPEAKRNLGAARKRLNQ
jgi:serine/threonine protein kinase